MYDSLFTSCVFRKLTVRKCKFSACTFIDCSFDKETFKQFNDKGNKIIRPIIIE
jgi:hypothetical protein